MNQKHFDLQMMQRCIQLAINGNGNVAPNPLVGSVITLNNKIIGEGYHRKYGEAHAEVNAITSVENKELLKEATLYVNLEPCSHQGKTPPCADLIIAHKIQRVVIGTIDPHAKVAGNGIKKLKKAGIEVKCGIAEKECGALNKRFFTFHQQKRPYVILKWAESSDGYIDTAREGLTDEHPVWLTNQLAKHMVHKWRSEEQAILVGRKTACMDNPELNIREWQGNNPIRIIVDPKLHAPKNLKIFNPNSRTLVFNHLKNDSNANIEHIKFDCNEPLTIQVLDELFKRNIQSVIIEGGANILNQFIGQNHWDEIRRFVGDIHLISGVQAPKTNKSPANIIKLDNNILYEYRND